MKTYKTNTETSMEVKVQAYGPTETRLYFKESTGEIHWRVDVHDSGNATMIYTVSNDGWIVAELETGDRAFWLRKPNAEIPGVVLSHLPAHLPSTHFLHGCTDKLRSV